MAPRSCSISTTRRRHATLDDFVNFARIAYCEPAMHMTGGVLCEPMDIAVPHRHLDMTYRPAPLIPTNR